MKQLSLFERCPACGGFIPYNAEWEQYEQEEIAITTYWDCWGDVSSSNFDKVIVFYDKCPLCEKGLVAGVYVLERGDSTSFDSEYDSIFKRIKRGCYGPTIIYNEHAPKRRKSCGQNL